jgi:outer membrane autotransporter protein
MRAHAGTHTVSLPGVEDFDIDTGGFGVSAMYGYQVKTRSGWNVEPQVQLTWSRTNVDETFDPGWRLFKVNTIASFRARLGGQVSNVIAFKPGARLTPSARAGLTQELEGKNDVLVLQYTDATRRYLRNRYDFSSDFSGVSGNLSAGAALRLHDHFDAWLDAGCLFGGKMESYTLNLGAAWHW